MFTIGQTVVNSKDTGKKIKSLGLASTTGKTAEYTKVTGNKIICMAKVSTNGLMVGNMRVRI